MKREDGMGGEAATGCDGGAIPSEPRLVLKKLAALRCLWFAGQSRQNLEMATNRYYAKNVISQSFTFHHLSKL